MKQTKGTGPKAQRLSCGIALVGVAVAAIGCGPGAAAEAIRPNDPTAAGALGESSGGACKGVEKQGEPLVVDWKPEQRGDLEVAMKEGVAVVSYSCDGIKLLRDCKIEGQYGFIGMTRREQVVQLENADEVRANLPLSGAKIGGELARGSTLDIALVMVGKTRTTWETPTKDDLKGSCDGATHFVRGATVGAFAMGTGTSAKVAAAAELFGANVGAGSESKKRVQNKDGDPADCQKATPTSPAAPPQCGAPLRLVLSAIAPAAKPAEAPPKEASSGTLSKTEEGCPTGLVFAKGKCTKPESAPAFQCKVGDAAQCTEQCDKGHAGSCGTLGAMHAFGDGVARDDAKAAGLFKKGCDGGDTKSCVNQGLFLRAGRGGGKDAAGAAKLFEKGCNDGDAVGCGALGQALLAGDGVTADAARGATLLSTGCEGGDNDSCGALAPLVVAGKGVPKDTGKGLGYYRRACDGGNPQACNDGGELFDAGFEGNKNPILANMMFMRACNRFHGAACTNMGRSELGKPGGGGSESQAKMYFERGCNGRSELGCAALVAIWGEKRVVVPSPAFTEPLRSGCSSGKPRDCTSMALVNIASGMKGPAKMDLDRACTMGDQFACFVAKKVK